MEQTSLAATVVTDYTRTTRFAPQKITIAQILATPLQKAHGTDVGVSMLK
jgi:hypothetical protein